LKSEAMRRNLTELKAQQAKEEFLTSLKASVSSPEVKINLLDEMVKAMNSKEKFDVGAYAKNEVIYQIQYKRK